jgi:hypothetical protein
MDPTVVSSIAVGWVVGFLVMFFVVRFSSWTAGVLSSVLALIFGGIVLEFLADGKFDLRFYAIGLAAGIITYLVLYGIENRSLPNLSGGTRLFQNP